MNELEKAYQEIESWHCYSEQEGFVDEEEMTYLDYVKKYINNLQSKIDKAIDKLESLLPMCIMPNNMLIHGTEKAKAIEETLDILKEDK